MEQTKEIRVNREYKDRLFKLIFREKKDLLELYNAINGTAYDNPEDIEINTMEDVVYLGMRNDLSFLIKDVLNLYEHQSTFSPNFPLRGLFYFADLYRKIVGENRDYLYSSRLIGLPTPQFVIFYNGTQQEPERRIMRLSDAFVKKNPSIVPALECTAVVLNINLGSNTELLKKCTRLREYSQFVARVREKLAQRVSIEDAVSGAVDECIEEGILADILSANKEVVMDTLLTEYDEEGHLRAEREIAREEGEILKLISQVRKKRKKSMSADEIAEILEEELPVIDGICRIIDAHPEWEDTQVYEEYARADKAQ